MRPLSVLLAWLVALGCLAVAATTILSRTSRTWYERDVAMRARLVVGGARESIVDRVSTKDSRRLAALLEHIARDERITAVAACDPSGATIASTRGFPPQFACDGTGWRERTEQQWVDGGGDFSAEVDGAPVHVSVVPIVEASRLVATIVLVHDMSFVARREAATRRVTIGAFALVAVLASVLTVVLRRLSWKSWTMELLHLLRLNRTRRDAGTSRRQFQPLIADLREAVADLAREGAEAAAGAWSPQRLQATLERSLHGDGVVVVANREPYIHERAPDGTVRIVHPASGLVTALEPVMRACSGTWVAHGSGTADRENVDGHDRLLVPPGEKAYALRRVWLSHEEEAGYYYGFSNEGLWPLCHIAHARPVFRAPDWHEYQVVNERFAEAACSEAAGSDPVILVQDYHFALVPKLIRRKRPRATVLTFWHIPWPNAERFGICPWEREILTGLLGSSVIGFHTQLHCNNFMESVDRYLEARVDREAQAIVLGGRQTLVRSYPISIEWPSRWAEQARPVVECRASVLRELGLEADALLGVGVDRLDYTKGIEERLLAVDRALERFPHLQGRFTFVQLAAPSRTVIERYRELNERVERLANLINQRFATGTYRPIVLLRSHHEPPEVFRFLRAADLCYVSSLHDGMNLVAKEFVAARDDERGVLVLSRFTGAARELTEALIVNPYDLEQASAALATALTMPPAEQADRMRAMRALVAELNVYRWAGKMLQDAARVRQHGRLSDRLTMGIRSVTGGAREADPRA